MTRKSKLHTVTMLDTKIGACTCEDLEYGKRVCKHIVEVMIKVIGIILSIMSDRDPNKQPEKLELQARQIAMILGK